MRRAALLALAATVAGGGCRFLSREFRITGTITVASHLRHKLPKGQAVLFIVAKNTGGVPVAVRRIVNPQFPVRYTLSPEDLIVPGTNPKEDLIIQVQMNTHGNVGTAARGDLEGVYDDIVHSGERGVHIVIDTAVE